MIKKFSKFFLILLIGVLFIGRVSAAKITTAPTITVKDDDNNTVLISWDSVDNATSYEVYRSTKKDSGYTKVATTTSTRVISVGLTYGQTYYFKVKAINSTSSKESSAVSGVAKPNKMTLKAYSIGSKNIEVYWESLDVSGYEIYFGTETGDMKKVKTVTNKSTTTYNKTSLEPNTIYYFKARAYATVDKKDIYGAFSSILAVKTEEATSSGTLLDNPLEKAYKELIKKTFDMSNPLEKYTIEECGNNDAADTVTIRWDGKTRKIIGAIWGEYRDPIFTEVTATATDVSKSEADQLAADFNRETYRIPSCCYVKDPKDGPKCEGSQCNPTKCTPTNGSSQTNQGGACKCYYTISPTPYLTTTVNYDGACVGSSCICAIGSVKSNTCSTSTTQYYNVNCSGKKITGYGPARYDDRNIYTLWYDMDINGKKENGDKYESDYAYCLQPGASGPTEAGLKYVLDASFDIAKCNDQYTVYNSKTNRDENAVQCGLAQMLYLTNNCNKDTLKCTPNKKYSNEAITLALRLWMSAYAVTEKEIKTYSTKIDPDGEDAEIDILGWKPRENYYDITAKAIRKGGTYNTSNAAIKNNTHGLIGCAESEEKAGKKCVINEAIELFHAVENTTKENFMGGISFDKKVPVISTNSLLEEVVLHVDEDFQKFVRECSDINSPSCKLEPHYFVNVTENGKNYWKDVTKDVELKLIRIDSSKNNIIYRPIYKEEYCVKGADTLKIVITSKEWKRNHGYVKFFTAANGKDKYQKMVSFGLNLEECRDSYYDAQYGRIEDYITLPCPCKENTCSDMNGTVNKKNCSTSTVEDASMSCIVNACNKNDAEIYEVSEQYGVNRDFCTIYERETTKLYIPDETSVYSGMQFSYDITSDFLKDNPTIKTTLTASNSKKITSIALQQKQITSKINYIYWKNEYDRKIELLEDSIARNRSNSYVAAVKSEIDGLLAELDKCNLVGVEDQNKNKYKVCTGSTCINLSVEYDDPNYGGNKDAKELTGISPEMARNTGVVSTNKYYCKGSKCYAYSSKSSVSIDKEIEMASKGESGYSKNGTTEKTKGYSGNRVISNHKSVSNNDYATIIINVENDYYLKTRYATDAYTGKVQTVNDGVNSSNSTMIGAYSYPVSFKEKTGKKDISFTFTNLRDSDKKYKENNSVSANSIKSVTGKCFYKVYNVTSSYDCKITNKKGEVDISQCTDTSYKVENGVPTISTNQITWNNGKPDTNEKLLATQLGAKNKMGFVYRSVDLAQLFPEGKDHSNTNWSYETDKSKQTENDKIIKNAIDAIQSSSEDIFVKSEYLQYRYILTPQTIKAIQQYNKNQLANGGAGYLNNTLYDCKKSTDSSGLEMFTECKSRFLHNKGNGLPTYTGVKISGSKAVNG